MLKTIELPYHAHIGALSDYQRHVSVVHERPAHIRLRITMPVDLWAQIKDTSEQRDSVIENCFSFQPGFFYRARKTSSDGGDC